MGSWIPSNSPVLAAAGCASGERSPRPAGGAAAAARPDTNEPGGPAPCRKWLRRGRAQREGSGGRAGAMAATEAAAAESAAPVPGVPVMPASTRGAAAASSPWGPSVSRLQGNRPRPARARAAAPVPPARELIQPSVSELSRAVRTNILCTVRGCGKILPNSPALNMHLVKSHRLQVSGPRRGRGVCAVPGHLRPTVHGESAGRAHVPEPATSRWRAHNTSVSCLFTRVPRMSYRRCHGGTQVPPQRLPTPPTKLPVGLTWSFKSSCRLGT